MEILKQPKELNFICATNLWERFGYYMMRGILVLYMTQILSFSNSQSYGIFAAFTSLLFLAPLIGGHLADIFLGTQRSVLIGAASLSLGYLLLAMPTMTCFYFGLAMIIIGSGFFVPNISSVLGAIYQENDSRREGGFSILYSAINVGAFIPPIIAGWIVMQWGWHTAFLISSLGTFLSFIIFYLSIYKKPKTTSISFLNYGILLISIIFCSASISFLLKNTIFANSILCILSSFLIIYTVVRSLQFSSIIKKRIFSCLFLTGFSIVFCVLCEQAAMSLTIYTEYNVNRNFYHWLIPTVSFLSLNPFFIIVCGPLFSRLWLELEKRQINLSIPMKFACGTLLVGLGFIVLPFANSFYSNQGQIHFGWIVLSYFIQSLGELLVYPVGLAMMTELAPKQMVGLMIGVWYLATAIANLLGGLASKLTTLSSGSNDPLLTSVTYNSTFNSLGWIAIASAFIIYMSAPKIKKIMHANVV